MQHITPDMMAYFVQPHIIIRYAQLKNQPHILALSVFPDTKIQRYKNQKS